MKERKREEKKQRFELKKEGRKEEISYLTLSKFAIQVVLCYVYT